MLNYIASDCTEEEQEKAKFELDRALVDLPSNKKYSLEYRLLYEFKKLSYDNLAKWWRLLISLELYDAALKTVISKLLYNDNDINRATIVSRITLPKATDKEKKLPIHKRYDHFNPWKWKITIFDRWINNLSLCLKPNGYCTKQQYDYFMKTLDGLLERYLKEWITLKNFFLYITKEVQAQRMKERSENPSTWDRVSESDLNSSKNYNEILEEMLKLIEIYEKAWAPITLVNTSDPELWIINTLKAILNDFDYEKKSELLDLTPNSDIVWKTKEEVMRIIEPTNEEIIAVMKSKIKK